MSKLHPTLNVKTLSLCLMFGAITLSACAHRPAPPPATALEACVSPDPAQVKSVSDLALHSLAQEAVIANCEAKRRALINLYAPEYSD